MCEPFLTLSTAMNNQAQKILLLTTFLLCGAGEACAALTACSITVDGKTFALKGKYQVVDSFADIKVQIVSNFPDLKVQKVANFPDECGKWQEVSNFPDFKVQFVSAFADLKVEYVDNFPGVP
jgi:hypothetical protein